MLNLKVLIGKPGLFCGRSSFRKQRESRSRQVMMKEIIYKLYSSRIKSKNLV